MINMMSNAKIGGIYKIINKINGKYYVGSSDDIKGTGGRWREHINDLNRGDHDNEHLQRAWKKYGQENFNFFIIEEAPKNKLFIVEQKYLDQAKLEKRKTYNMTFTATGGGFLGHHHSEKTKKQISQKLKGRIISQYHRERISITQKGNKNFLGKSHTNEWKKRQRLITKQMWKEGRFLKGENNPLYKSVSNDYKSTLREFYLKNGSMDLYKEAKEKYNYGSKVITRFIKEVKLSLKVPSKIHFTDARSGYQN